MLDADEVMTDALRAEIERKLPAAAADVAGFRMCRKTMFLGSWLKMVRRFPVWIMRLVRRGAARFQDSGHGEVPVPPVTGRLETLAEPFLHYPFSRGIGDWVERHNRYARSRRRGWSASTAGQRHSPICLRARSRRPTARARREFGRRLPGRPLCAVLYQYVGQLGFLEWPGRAGILPA